MSMSRALRLAVTIAVCVWIGSLITVTFLEAFAR
jgi:hypothetical protein